MQSASSAHPSAPDRPGSTPCEIDFNPETMVFVITKRVNGLMKTKKVHIVNVASWEELPPEKKAEPQVKK